MASGESREDPRYRQAGREALMGLLLFAANFVWWFGFAYGLGNRPVSEYTYVFGFPAWFFYSAIMGYAVFSALAWLMVKYLFKDVPLDGEGGGKGE
ncbi:MAG: YhdT family protein [Ignavibacteriales bacterium]